MAKYIIDMGHTLKGVGTGAVGILAETDVNRVVGNKVVNYLKSQGHTVVNATVDVSSNDLYDRVQIANKNGGDFFLSIHCNSYGNPSANGTETFIYNGNYGGKEANRAKAKAINDELVKALGTHNRGVKEANYYVLKNTTMPAALVELFFITNQADCNKYDADKIARAIVKGLTGKAVETSSNNASNTTQNTSNYTTGLYKVNTDVLNIRSGAGTNYKVVGTVKNGEVYTITEVIKADGYNWGKLKSGAGFIALEYCIKR